VSSVRIDVLPTVHLSAVHAGDKAAYLLHLKDKDIYDRVIAIPYPYRGADADEWIARVTKETARQGSPVEFAIRDETGFLIGGVGFHGLELGKTHKAELGYWLAKPYWGQGIMTAVVARLCTHALGDWGLVRIFATVFPFHRASARILEKCGFAREGYLRKYVEKDGQLLDLELYARVREP
jgi:RimJ/RimL family protein N-acetyltransferase